jgi:putative hydrolase of the HAD superfamily
VTVRTVIFDWGGTLTPWHSVDHETLWRAVCVKHYSTARAAEVARALYLAERDVWAGIERSQESATLTHVIERARVNLPDAVLASYFEAWEPHTITDPGAPVLLHELRRRNIRIGVLSNTLWPRAVHDQIFVRDQVLDLIDSTVYSCELPWTKPHPAAFRAAMAAVGEDDPASCVFVGDRPFDDVHGAKSIGMRAVLMQGSNVPPFEAAVPDATITRLSQLLPYLDRW